MSKNDFKLIKFGEVVVSQRNGEPYIEVRNFEADGVTSAQELPLFAIQYAAKALLAALPPSVANQIRGEMK